MKRGIITNNWQGIHISDGEVWMTTWELADLFYTTAGAIHAAIKRILKTNIWHYKIFCVNVKYGIQYEFRIFLFNSFAK